MTTCPFRLLALSFPLVGLISCSQPDLAKEPPLSTPETTPASALTPTPAAATSSDLIASSAAGRDLTQLFSKIWRITDAPSQPASGSIYIFLAGGTFLQTSCVETYAISGWTIDKANPQVLQVSENGEIAYTAEILELTDTTLQLRQRLVRSNETQDITLTAIEEAFVCPDLPV